jgi:hypothetical protein
MSKLSWGRQRRTMYVLGAAVGLTLATTSAQAALSTGAGGSGVTAGSSSLIGQYDYSDTWTSAANGGHPDRVFSAVLTDAGYQVENRYTNPARGFLQDRGVGDRRPNMSIARDVGTPNGLSSTAASPYPGSSGAGSGTGFTQQGSGANFFQYGIYYRNTADSDLSGSPIRQEFVAQFDSTQTSGQVLISVAADPGISTDAVSGNGSLIKSLFVGFNGDNATDAARANKVALITYVFDAGLGDVRPVETLIPTLLPTGLAGNRKWHNYAVRFDRADNEVEIYLDEVSLGKVDLLTFANGQYKDFSIGSVNVGASTTGTSFTPGGNRIWTDNFQVGAVAVPEPLSAGALSLASLGTLLMGRRRRAGR